MKKILIGLAVAVVIFGAFGVAGFVYARSTLPALNYRGYGSNVDRGGMMGYQRNGSDETGRGGMMGYQRNDTDEISRSRMMGGRGGMMGNQRNASGEGILHDKMTAAFAEKLGMSSTDLETRLDKGETMAQVAESQGVTSEKFTTMMTEAHTQVLDQAVKDGTLTQEQADWMKERGTGMEYGRGRSAGGWMDCPYDDDKS